MPPIGHRALDFSTATLEGVPVPVTSTDLFFRSIFEEDFLDLAGGTDRDKARPARGSQARVKWLGGEPETGPWVYYAEHPTDAVVKPHKHHAARVEYIIDGEIEFFVEDDAVRWFRGDEEVRGTRHGQGTVSYVPAGRVYAYRIVSATKLLHVFYDNPVGATEHVE